MRRPIGILSPPGLWLRINGNYFTIGWFAFGHVTYIAAMWKARELFRIRVRGRERAKN